MKTVLVVRLKQLSGFYQLQIPSEENYPILHAIQSSQNPIV